MLDFIDAIAAVGLLDFQQAQIVRVEAPPLHPGATHSHPSFSLILFTSSSPPNGRPLTRDTNDTMISKLGLVLCFGLLFTASFAQQHLGSDESLDRVEPFALLKRDFFFGDAPRTFGGLRGLRGKRGGYLMGFGAKGLRGKRFFN